LIKLAPFVRKLATQVLVNVEIGTDKGTRKALGGVRALPAEHDAVVAFHLSRIPPVSSSCIMPCLSWRAFPSLASIAAISASMSERMAAMAVCSESVGVGIVNALSHGNSILSTVVPDLRHR